MGGCRGSPSVTTLHMWTNGKGSKISKIGGRHYGMVPTYQGGNVICGLDFDANSFFSNSKKFHLRELLLAFHKKKKNKLVINSLTY